MRRAKLLINKKRGLLTIVSSIVGVYVTLVIAFGIDQKTETLGTVIDKNPSKLKEEKGLKKDEPGMFLKLHNYIQTEEGKDRPEYTAGYQVKEYTKAKIQSQRSIQSARAVSSLNVTWEERGPGNVAGRTPGLWVDLSDDTYNTWLAGSSGGGIWKTTDGGETWAPKTDNLPNQTVSGVMGSKADANIVYAGTGKRFVNRAVPGNGILKSLDKGETWEVIPSTLDNPKFVNISRIGVDQSNPDNIVASTFTDADIPSSDEPFQSYVFKSTDGGTTWTELLSSSTLIQQVITSETNFDLQFISLNGTSIQRTIDGGTTWETVFNSSSVDLDGFSLDRMEVAIAPTNNDHIFIAAYLRGSGEDASMLIFSDDQGDNWSIVRGKDNDNNFGNWLSRQGWYDNTIAVHPYDENIVYVAGVSAILKLTVEEQDGDDFIGSREVLSDGYGAYGGSSKGVHVDHHHLLLLPIDETAQTFHLLNGNDGGVAISKDDGVTFKQTGDTFKEADGTTYDTFLGYNTVEFYGVDKKNGGDRYIAGSQDNGSWLSGTDPGITSVWFSAPSGDGFQAAWHYDNTNLILESSQFNNIFLSTNEGASWSSVQLPVSGGPFLTEIENSKQDPDLVFVVSSQGVIRSLDFADTWEVISMPSSWVYNGFTTPVAISLANPEVVWSGTGVGASNRIAVSRDGGTTWEETAQYAAATRGGATNLTTHPSEEGTAYVMFSQANGPKVLKTSDYGASWSDITGFDSNVDESTTGFPDVPAYSMVVMPYDNDIIWVGTAIGIVESRDGGASWALKTDHNLPAVAVWDMRIVNDEVIIATHGRGIWSATLPELDGYEPVEVVLAPSLDVSSEFYRSEVSGSVLLRSEYASTKITLRGTFGDIVVDEITDNTEDQVVDWSYDLASELENALSDLEITVIIESKSGVRTLTRMKESTVFKVFDSVETYIDDLDEDVEDRLLLDGMNDLTSVAVSGSAMHSPHPYSSNSVYQFILRTPFALNASEAILKYSDIAIVEPGENNTNRIWDYVAIEGLKINGDGSEDWVTLDRYDARRFGDWLNAYNGGTTPTDALFEVQELDLFNAPMNSFSQGDVVIIRFALYTDPAVEGYGWIVDDISFNEQLIPPPLNVADELDSDALTAYPNPVATQLKIDYTMNTNGLVKISVIDMRGTEVDVLVNNQKQVGDYQTSYDVNALQTGTYFVKMETAEGSIVKKILVR